MLSTTAYPGIEYYAREDFENLCEQANINGDLMPI